MIVIRAENRPRIMELLTAQQYAIGGVHRHRAEPEHFLIPDRFGPFLDTMEARIEHLTNEEIETFVGDGEEGEILRIAGLSEGLTKSYELMEFMLSGERA
jgi:hypothetical protein